MATKLNVLYPGPNQTIINANWPNGGPNNSSVPGALDGTPEDEGWKRDIWGFLERIREVDGFIPSGTPDNALVSQRYDALERLARNDWPDWDVANTYKKGAVVIASDDKTYQSLQSANVNHDPVSSPTWWKEFRPVDVIDNLTTADPISALSSNQGVVLKNLFDGIISATISQEGLALLDKQIITSPNGADPGNDIDFAAGVFQFTDGSGKAIGLSLTKRIDASWALGNNQGGFDTGSMPATGLYYRFAIYNPVADISDYLFSQSFSSPVLPAGFTKKSYLGSGFRVAGVNYPYTQFGNSFFYTNPFNVYAGFPTPAVIAVASPAHGQAWGLFNIRNQNNTYRLSLHPTFATVPAENVGTAWGVNYTSVDNNMFYVPVDVSGNIQLSQIVIGSNASVTDVRVDQYGIIDFLV